MELNRINWKVIGICVSVPYLLSMVVIPVLSSGGSWDYVQRVWSRWQEFNAAMIALLSAGIALWASNYRYVKQREGDLAAARAFLAEALSELTSYCDNGMRFCDGAWRHAEELENKRTPMFNFDPPKCPDGYKSIFSNCINYADGETRQRLALILKLLQIYAARSDRLHKAFTGVDKTFIAGKRDVCSLFFLTSLISALVSKLFPYARFEETSIREPEINDLVSAFVSSRLNIETYKDLMPDLQERLRIYNTEAARGNFTV